MDASNGYPARWEADVVLSDGATAHLRPITPDDAGRLVEFYARVSDESKYYRFFSPYPTLSRRDVELFTNVDHTDRVALIVLSGDDMIAVGRYDRIGERDAEVAFLVEDGHQGRGIGSVLLEHLAEAARENGIRRFVAEVLPRNRKMLTVFAEAGYTATNTFDDGVVRVEFEIRPTEQALAVMAAREQRAEARSIQRLLTPRSVAVVGASRSPDKVGRTLVHNLVDGGFAGRVYAVNPGAAAAVAGVPAYPSVRDVPGDVDLAVVAVPAAAVPDVVLDCAAKSVKGLVVVSAGFAESGEEGRRRQAEVVRISRAHGMRVARTAWAWSTPTRSTGSTRRWRLWCHRPAGSGSSRSPVPSGRRSCTRSRSAVSACPRSCPRATGPTCRATTCCSTGRTTRPPRWCCSTWSRSGTRASSPGWRAGRPRRSPSWR